jgi:hypothetical protein
LALIAVLLFVEQERYSNNASAAKTANQRMNNSPMGEMMGGMMQQMTGQSKLEPSVPAAATYSLLFAAILGISGAACLVASGKGRGTDRDAVAMGSRSTACRRVNQGF